MTGCSYGGTLPFEVATNGAFCDYALYMYPTVYTVLPVIPSVSTSPPGIPAKPVWTGTSYP